MAKLKYRKGSEIFEIFDTDDIKALQTKVDEVPRLPTFGSTSGNWPFGVVYWNVSADKKRLSLHGNIYFDSCGDAWSAMKAIPGGASNEWGLQVATPLGAQSKALWIPAVGFSTTNSTISAQNIGDMEIREALRRHLRLRGPADAHGRHREHIFGEHLLRRLRRRLVPQRAVHRSAGRSRDDSIGTSDRVGRDGLELEAVNVVNADGAPAVGRPGDEHIRHGLLPRGRSLEVALTFRAPPLLRFPETLGREREWRS